MALAVNLTIATHPQPILLVGTGSQYPYRSTDGGVTWERAQNSQGGIRAYMFLEEDSTRLYIATWFGLLFSSDAGDTWEPAAGVLGKLNVSVLDYTVDYKNNYTILYAATNGGNPNDNVLHKSLNLIINQTTEGIQAKSIVVRDYSSINVFMPLINRLSEAPSALVDAGIYRYVSHQP